ncbi:MAG: peptide chain release factor-like protein [Rhodobacteraceae bacterium]|nr:peptide chain release factor-like protein [Paracoccaceae bacterium]
MPVKVLDVMRNEAEAHAVDFDVSMAATKHGLKSAVFVLSGPDAEAFAGMWRGTIQWRAKSTLRPQHKRANWFIGAFELPEPARKTEPVHPRDVTFESFHAGGPGGQHQNTTDSAVRATHKPTGLTAFAREMRSQHRNKALALVRLQGLMSAQMAADEEAQKSGHNHLHNALERGNPVRRFKGRGFREDRKV